MDRIVEAHFDLHEGRWRMNIAEPGATGSVPAWRDWDVPDDLRRDLFRSIISRERQAHLYNARCRLRIRPRDLDPRVGPLPPIACWALMYDHNGHHIFYKGWTLAQMCAPLSETAWPFDDTITVIGDAVLAKALRDLGVSSVFEGDPQSPNFRRGGTLAVITSSYTQPEERVLQNAARIARCPLVMWTDSIPREVGRDLLELIPTSEPRLQPLEEWLAKYIGLLRVGNDPESALALTACTAPPTDLRAHWLRGTLRPWPKRNAPDVDEVMRYWRYEIDRSRQQAALTDIVNDLVPAAVRRRMHVVIVPGAEGAGLDFFRKRPLNLRVQRAEEVSSFTWEPPWSDRPAETLDSLLQWVEAENVNELALRLVEQSRGEVVLVHCNHLVADVRNHFSIPDLRIYVERLKELAQALDGQPVRVLVTMCVLTNTPSDLLIFEDMGDMDCAVSVLDPLPATIPDGELQEFLKRKGIVNSRQEFEALKQHVAGLTYEQLVPWLANRFFEKLLPR